MLYRGDPPRNDIMIDLSQPRVARASPDAKGHFRFPHLAPGSYVVFAGVVSGDRAVRRVTLGENETVDLGDLGLRRHPPIPIEVSVPAGERLPPSIRFTYRLPAKDGLKEGRLFGLAVLDGHGRGEVSGPPPGTQTIIFQADGFASREVTMHVRDRMEPVQIHLEPKR